MPRCSDCGLPKDPARAIAVCCGLDWCLSCLSKHDVDQATSLAHVPDAGTTYGLEMDCG